MTITPLNGGDAVITIQNIRLPIVEYRGHRVVTFAIIDQVHERPEGTAKRNFSDNRDRFRSGEDYFLIPKSEANGFRTFGIEVPNRGLTVLTEQGYLMVVKSLTDDLAWTVQRQLVNSYFRPQPFTVPQTRAEAMRLAADLEEQNGVLLLENKQQADTIASLESLFMTGETPTQFCKRLNGVNCSQVNSSLLRLGWIYNAATDENSKPRYRVASRVRDRYLTERPRKISAEGVDSFIKYDLILLLDGACRLHQLYLKGDLTMKSKWDGRHTLAKYDGGDAQ
ncbi:ORF6N domain-containing protein [Pseudomonas lactis]|uniref:ORF6N domain-containing protein n=1 Tax=Pseudomonas lactis TaxID=1615674 RepID=UPI001A0F0D57|nr:ORF6N domain-containing protein [Pseudomonas lactis]MBA6043779.1 phage antirepressor protein [Pseudomonas lactis]